MPLKDYLMLRAPGGRVSKHARRDAANFRTPSFAGKKEGIALNHPNASSGANLTLGTGIALTRLPPDCDPGVGTLSRNAGEGLQDLRPQTLSCIAGEAGPSPQGWVGEG